MFLYMPWRQWRCSSTHTLSRRWRWLVSFTFVPLFLQEICSRWQFIRTLVDFRIGLGYLLRCRD